MVNVCYVSCVTVEPQLLQRAKQWTTKIIICHYKVSLYQGSFHIFYKYFGQEYNLLVIPRTSFHGGSLKQGSTVL